MQSDPKLVKLALPDPMSGHAGAVPEIVAVGAAAGGFDAVARLFSLLPPDPPMAFVLVQRLARDFLQLMTEALASQTEMALKQVEDGHPPSPATIYLLASDQSVTIEDGHFRVSASPSGSATRHPIDLFLSSLARERRGAATAIILSGGGTDGAAGAQQVIEAGGRVFIQQPSTAKFPSMPKAAYENCRQALILPVSRMADLLMNGRERTDMGQPGAGATAMASPLTESDPLPESLIASLRHAFDIDLTELAHEFVGAALKRAMAIHALSSTEALAARLASDQTQLAQFADLVRIGRHSFFDEGDTLQAMAHQSLPGIVDQVHSGEEVRIWLPVCGHGEEAYTVAAMLVDQLGSDSIPPTITIIAQDEDPKALANASRGPF